MHASRRRRVYSTTADEPAPERKPFDIPYFAHQRLDPQHFPDNVGRPIGGPPANHATNAASRFPSDWDGDEEATEVELTDGDVESVDRIEPEVSENERRTTMLPNDGETYKRMKLTGGRPAVAKKVKADMDSDDEIIFSMKNAKYLEKDIAKRLADEGRMRYNPKTIGSRWARLKRVMQTKQDELLDADLTDWHEGDDEVLYAAIKVADQVVERAKQEAEERRWRIVADTMKSMKPVTNFSRNACMRRLDALQKGTAKPTPESIANPSTAVKARIEARRARERKITEDQKQMTPNRKNIQGNAWTSKQRLYFG